MFEQHSYTEDYNNPYKFNGKELDEETGFYYYGARYYDPKISVWLSVDPLVEETMDSYGYCYHNPINLVDPDGMKPKPFPKMNLGSTYYYKWRYNNFIYRNPNYIKQHPEFLKNNYYLNYGHKYINRFTNETNKQLSKQGKQWLVNARRNLQVAIEDKLKADPTIELRNGGNDFKEFAFKSHVGAYWNAGLYKLNTVDLVAIVLTPNFKDLTSEDGMKQATEMMGKLTDYWLDNPKEGLKRGAELLANQDKIKAMVTAKAIREGIDPDKAMPILDKIIEKIPTIKTD
ncbi:RHS repeat-associated core domain-containing protein [Flavobacterium sp. 20NA77.7]|uniref:RHS repeat-associated core domain-containing protein n=1 Tax=Flavobacterium nakdongensis TaxID=3073563 RepID=A0ABY9RAT9_9FLAO|nr:RHS repeat-associated core domain-containing protein [Flavobacterium sp. 20NA77.7]WMW78269.1 RHS repeat-associated core domain-containing protein [Flavobacterium sp. 20NA77.7]